MGLVTGVLGAIRIGISAIATSMYSSILNIESAKYIPQHATPAALGAGLPESSLPAIFAGITLGDFSAVPEMTTDIIMVVGDAVKQACSLAFRTVFLRTLPFGAMLLIATALSTNEVARKHHSSSEKPEQNVRKELVDEV
jgi:hypothetical protein